MPLDETSDFFDIDSLQEIDELCPDEKIIDRVRVWDIQSGESIKSDYTVGSMIVETNIGRIGVTDIIRGQFEGKTDTKIWIKDLETGEPKEVPLTTKNKIIQIAQRDGYNVKILIETGVATAKLLFKEWKEQLIGFRVTEAEPIKSKPDRATPLKNGITDHKFFILINNPVLLEITNSELSSFPEGQHDDIVDTFAYGYNYFHFRPKPAQIYI